MSRLVTLMLDFRKAAWIDHYSEAAFAAYKRGGGGVWHDFNEQQQHRLNWFGQILNELGDIMNGRKSKGFIPNIKFVDLELTSDGKAEFKRWEWTDEDTIAYIERMGTEGYKIGARYDRANGTWIASLTCNDEKLPNYAWCLSARGRSWLHAFAILAYKDVVLLEGDWTESAKPEDNDAGWG